MDDLFQLKGSDSSKVQSEVEEIIKEVGLEFKRKTQAGNLSGGQKRKLSVGIAFISGSKVLGVYLSAGHLWLLDETGNRRERGTGGERERERERETERDRQRQTETERQTETDRHTDRQADTHTDTQTKTERQRQRQRETERGGGTGEGGGAEVVYQHPDHCFVFFVCLFVVVVTQSVFLAGQADIVVCTPTSLQRT